MTKELDGTHYVKDGQPLLGDRSSHTHYQRLAQWRDFYSAEAGEELGRTIHGDYDALREDDFSD